MLVVRGIGAAAALVQEGVPNEATAAVFDKTAALAAPLLPTKLVGGSATLALFDILRCFTRWGNGNATVAVEEALVLDPCWETSFLLATSARPVRRMTSSRRNQDRHWSDFFL
jgi:hypothetical protein